MTRTLPPDLSRLLDSQDQRDREDAWAAFVDRHSRLLLHTARAVGGDYDSAMDRYCFVLEQLRRDDFKRLRAYAADGRSSLSTWLVVVARRLCLDHHRKRYGRARSSSATGLDAAQERAATRRRLTDLVGKQVDLLAVADGPGGDPEALLRRAELEDRLGNAIGALEPRDRLLLALRYEYDVPVREIAEIMDFPTVFHVYRRLDVLRRSLRRRLEGTGVDDAAP